MTWLYVSVSILLLPLAIACIDVVGAVRARYAAPAPTDGVTCEDFNVIVPIYGSIGYLQNVEYLSAYGDRVVLCTTGSETPEFMAALERIAAANGFRVFVGHPERRSRRGRRDTGGTTRDRLVRDVLQTLDRPYTVCIDADTVTHRPLDELVGCVEREGYDFVSVPLEPANRKGLLARLQVHEYRLAMALRRVVPWLVSGGCHAGRTAAMARVMSRHSLFFQGNDVEAGLIAETLGYRVGHIPFAVPTIVPSTPRSWFRQRLAWAGGEFRLFVVNVRIIRRHPFIWTYGLAISFVGVLFRWFTVVTVPAALVTVLVVYEVLLLALLWRQRDLWLLAMPLYTAFNSLVLIVLAPPSYLRMALTSRNAGIILAKRRRASPLEPARQRMQ